MGGKSGSSIQPRQNILYILGAGFSQPLGLPLMGDFIFKAKDLFAAEPDKYAHFEDVFAQLGGLSEAKN